MLLLVTCVRQNPGEIAALVLSIDRYGINGRCNQWMKFGPVIRIIRLSCKSARGEAETLIDSALF